jgi:hypothetical protein
MGSRPQFVRLASAAVLPLVISSCSMFATSTEVAHDWALTGIDGNTVAVVVAVGSSSCDRFKGVEVAETATEVSITALVAEKEAGSGLFGAGCTDDLGVEIVDVVLDQPLGDRTLTGCAPGDTGLEDYFGEIDGGRISVDCAEIIDSW